MDIANIGAQYMNSSNIPFGSAAGSASIGVDSAEAGAFGDLMKKVQNSPVKESSSALAGHKPPIDKNDKLYELCMELETFLVKNLIKSMRQTVQKSKLIDTGFAGEVYEDMLYDEYAKAYSKNANFGFAEMAYRELASLR